MPSINLHLFSVPGKNNISDVVEACRPYLKDKDEPVIAFMPLAFLNGEKWLEYTKEQFKGLARVEIINTELMRQKEIEDILRDSAVAYISGGNTFLLNHRLHSSGVMSYLKKKIQAGLPVVGFSAGTILCGPNILTSTDMNMVKTPHFDGLNATPFNFFAHYPLDAYGQSVQDDWLSEYYTFHDNSVIMLCDGAYVKVDGKKTTLVRGEAYILRKDQEKEKLEEGKLIVL